MGDGAHVLRERQLNEIEVLQSMYPPSEEHNDDDDDTTSGSFRMITTEENMEGVRQNVNVNDGIKIRFEIRAANKLSLEFEFPLEYPHTPLQVHVAQPELPKELIQELQRLGNETAESHKEEEAAMHVINAVTERFHELYDMLQQERANKAAMEASSSTPKTPSNPVVGRRLLHFHHIKSSKKKRSITEWASELKLQGMCKPGYPGLLFIEGDESNCEDYVHRLKRLRWKSIEVRAEESQEGSSTESLDDLRLFHEGFQLLSEEETSHFTKELERIGKGDFVKGGILRMG